jgi:hypothetical protein
MRKNLRDCPKNSRIYTGIYMWRRERAEAPPLRECSVYHDGVTWDYMCGGRKGEMEGGRRRERVQHSQPSSNHSTSTANSIFEFQLRNAPRRASKIESARARERESERERERASERERERASEREREREREKKKRERARARARESERESARARARESLLGSATSMHFSLSLSRCLSVSFSLSPPQPPPHTPSLRLQHRPRNTGD